MQKRGIIIHVFASHTADATNTPQPILTLLINSKDQATPLDLTTQPKPSITMSQDDHNVDTMDPDPERRQHERNDDLIISATGETHETPIPEIDGLATDNEGLVEIVEVDRKFPPDENWFDDDDEDVTGEETLPYGCNRGRPSPTGKEGEGSEENEEGEVEGGNEEGETEGGNTDGQSKT